MDSSFNKEAIRAYSQTYSNRVIQKFFQEKQSISGEEIVKLTSLKQVNLFVLKLLFENWNKQMEEAKSPYFNYSDKAVAEIFTRYKNTLSRHILVSEDNVRPLLEQAVYESILLIVSPYHYYDEELRKHGDEIEIKLLKNVRKFVKVNVEILDAIINKMESDPSRSNDPITTLDVVLEETNLIPDEIAEYIEAFNSIYTLDFNKIYEEEGDVIDNVEIPSITTETEIEETDSKENIERIENNEEVSDEEITTDPTENLEEDGTERNESDTEMSNEITEEINEETSEIENTTTEEDGTDRNESDTVTSNEITEEINEETSEIENTTTEENVTDIVEDTEIKEELVVDVEDEKGEESIKTNDELIISEDKSISKEEIYNEIETIDEESQEEELDSEAVIEDQLEVPNEYIQETLEENNSVITLNDTFSGEEESLAELHQKKSVEKIETSITLNQRFMFVNGLFDGDVETFNATITTLDNMDNYEQAVTHMAENFDHWDNEDEDVVEFFDIVKRRFL